MALHDHQPTARSRTFMWTGVGLGLLLIVFMYTKGFGLLNRTKSAEETPALVKKGAQISIPEGSALRDRIGTVVAVTEQVSGKLTFPGVVESDPARTAAVLPPLGGRVLELKVGLGDRVQRGQLLAVIESPDLAQAYDDDEKAADTLALTRKNLSRQEEQVKLGVASDRDLDQARSDFVQAQAEFTRTQVRLKAVGADEKGSKRSRLLSVRAPVGGSITALSIAPGNVINDPTQPILTIADLATVWVTALVSENDLGDVSKGEDAEVVLAAYPDKPREGKVSFVSDVIEPDSHRNKLRIAFANADYQLKPNMFALVTLQGPKKARVVLPTSALLMNNDRTSVFVAVAPWTFERRTVETQLEEGGSVPILSGVNPGEQVVVKGGILLND